MPFSYFFSRGNHESGGYLASNLSKYVGSADRGFYYTLKIGSLSMLVLDTANYMSDGNALASYPVVRGSIRSNAYADKEGRPFSLRARRWN